MWENGHTENVCFRKIGFPSPKIRLIKPTVIENYALIVVEMVTPYILVTRNISTHQVTSFIMVISIRLIMLLFFMMFFL